MDVLAARNQTSVRNQLAGDWLQPRWEWSGHLFSPILSHTVVCQPPLPLDFLQRCYLLLQLPRICSNDRPAPFLPSSVSAGAGASHLIEGKVDKEMTLTALPPGRTEPTPGE